MSDQFPSHPSHQAKFPVNRGFNWVEPTTMLKPPKSGNSNYGGGTTTNYYDKYGGSIGSSTTRENYGGGTTTTYYDAYGNNIGSSNNW